MSNSQSAGEALRERHAPGSAFATLAAGLAPRGEVLSHPATQPTRCTVFVRNLRLDARIGVYDWEKAELQPLVVDLEFETGSRLACHTDRLDDTVDYGAVVARLRELVVERHFELVEAMAEAMAMLLQRDFGVAWLKLTLTKLAPFPGVGVGIEFERGQRGRAPA